MASVLLRGRSSTTSRTMPRYTSSLTDLSRNGEIPMMNREGDSPLKPWPAAPESGGKKLRAQRPVTTTRNFSLLTFFSATGGQVVGFMLICCRGLIRLIAVFSPGHGRRGRQTAARFDGIEVAAQVLRQLIQNHLSFLGLILPLCRLPVKDGRAVCDQSGQLIFQPQQISGCFAQGQSLTGDASLQTFPFLAQLREGGIIGQSHRAVPCV